MSQVPIVQPRRTSQDQTLREILAERTPIIRSRPRLCEGATINDVDPLGDASEFLENWM